MENTILQHIEIQKYSNAFLSNGFVLENSTVHKQSIDRTEVTDKADFGLSEPIAFYASSCGETFKVGTASGHVFIAEKKSNYSWECAGEMEERVLGMIFNENNGNLLILLEDKIILLDKYFECVRTEFYKPEVKAVVSRKKDVNFSAEWSPDGKYILLCLGTVLSVYAYNLEFIADTLVVCNKIMNSRLIQTKKYLLDESAYVDSMKRVPVQDDTLIRVEDTVQKDSVVFEERSNYKFASWYNRFSLIYAITDKNQIHILERNALKYKELFHIRECDRKEEKIENNDILFIKSYNDYLYIINQEEEKVYLKIYYIKNNQIYLKINQDLCMLAGKTIQPIKKISVTFEYEITLITPAETIRLNHTMCVNRTKEDVIDVDGCRLILYNLYRCSIPPPMYTRQVKLSGVPNNLQAFYNGQIKYDIEGKAYSENLYSTQASQNRIEDRISTLEIEPFTTEIPSTLEKKEIHIGNSKVTLSLKNISGILTIQYNSEVIHVENVSSVAPVGPDTEALLVSVRTPGWTEVHKISVDVSIGKFAQERVVRTGKDSRIVFVTELSVILIDTYGMLETFYVDFLLEKRIFSLLEKKEIIDCVVLAKKHGLSIVKYLDIIYAEIENDKLSAGLIYEVVNLLLNEDKTDWMIDKIEKYVKTQISKYLHSENSNTTNTEVHGWCNIAVEIYLFRKSPESIVELAEKFTTHEIIVPRAFFYSENWITPKKIIDKSIGTISAQSLLQNALNKYAYTLCYIILYCTDTPQDETNDILLVKGSESINPNNPVEETERRLKISRLTKNKRKQTLYMVKVQTDKVKIEKIPEIISIKDLKESIERECARDFYIYLIDIDELFRNEGLSNEEIEKIVCVVRLLLLECGDALVREGDHEEGLTCYINSGIAPPEKISTLRMKMGLWKELFAERSMRTIFNIQKMEEVLLSQKNVLAAAEMNLELGSVSKGIKYLTEIDRFDMILAFIKEQDQLEEPVFILKTLNTKVKWYTTSTQNMTEQYAENRARLQSVRERKHREREEIVEGIYADDDCETVYTRSFITNTFLSGTHSSSAKKKKRSSKLRNTVGGRYEEEYVQYVLSELIVKTVSQVKNIQKIEEIVENIRKNNVLPELIKTFKSDIQLYKNRLDLFYNLFHPKLKDDFVSLNTEDDPLYDPERPLIEEPSTKEITGYLGLTPQ